MMTLPRQSWWLYRLLTVIGRLGLAWYGSESQVSCGPSRHTAA